MKISEVLHEDKEKIRTYWQLRNDIDVELYAKSYQKIVDDQNTFRARQDMLVLSSHVQALLYNEDWKYLEKDPDFDLVYDSLLDLFDSIQEYLRKRR